MRDKRKYSYGDAYKAQIGYAKELACNLERGMKAGDFGTRSFMEALHTFENDADEVCHSVLDRLLMDFVVPYERNSMTNFTHALDDVSDMLENIAIKAYYYHYEDVGPAGLEMMAVVVKSAQSLESAIEVFSSNPKQREAIRKRLVEVQGFEGACDQIYIEALRALYGRNDVDPERRRIEHDMLGAIEGACDAIENAAEYLEAIMVENA